MTELVSRPSSRRWLVTGAAGFIGSHLVETLLRQGDQVIGVDNYSTGRPENLEAVRESLSHLPGGSALWKQFQMREGDIRNPALCQELCGGIDVVVHLAAMASVPQSIQDPELCHQVNVDGALHMILAAQRNRVPRFVFASSSAVYGDCAELPAMEPLLGNLLSPYAASKRIGEVYGQTFSSAAFQFVALRFFNVFGPRQPVGGPYAAVIPLWIRALLDQTPPVIYGDGVATRSFCYVRDVVESCIRAGSLPLANPFEVLNVAGSSTVSLNELFRTLCKTAASVLPYAAEVRPEYRPYRQGDILHSSASIRKLGEVLDFAPSVSLEEGLAHTLQSWMRADQQPGESRFQRDRGIDRGPQEPRPTL